MLGRLSQFTQEVRQSCQLVKSSPTLSFYLPLGQGHGGGGGGARTESATVRPPHHTAYLVFIVFTHSGKSLNVVISLAGNSLL